MERGEREALEKAIKATEYKYFGDYEFSDDQHKAVDTLVEFARAALRAQAPAVSGDVVGNLRVAIGMAMFKADMADEKAPAKIARILDAVIAALPTIADARLATAEAERDAAELRLVTLGLHPKMDMDLSDLCGRLGTMYSHRGDGIPTQFVNPDGPDAWAVIEGLNTKLADARASAKEADREE